jgi:hypothetical protein
MTTPQAARTYASRKKAQARGLPDDDSRHGTPNGYTYWGCRCADCTAAWSADCARRERAKEGTVTDGPTAGELRIYGRSLGLPIPHNKIPAGLAVRWNREHPDRPYTGPTFDPRARFGS